MSRRSISLDPSLNAYVVAHGVRESALQRRLRAETDEMPQADMQIAPEQGALLALLVRLIRARRILEVGTFTGYSALAMAQAMPSDGHLVCCDVNESFTAVARRYWAEAGLDQRIDLRLGIALETLERLRGEVRTGCLEPFDLAFVDANKKDYDAYYEAALEMLRPGGLVCLDNALLGGSVLDADDTSKKKTAIDRINAKIHADERVDIALVPIGDGLMMARKRTPADSGKSV